MFSLININKSYDNSFKCFCVVLHLLTIVYSLHSQNTTCTVEISQGILRGKKSVNNNGKEYYEFFGVPYAKPPIANLRFKIPQPPDNWNGVRDATAVNSSYIAMQLDLFGSEVSGNEDCLYLNVYTPTLDDSKLLPVMVYIHGGGFILANGILRKGNSHELLVESGVVLVTINYRLSVFGFLSLDIPEVTGNMGLKDQVKALEWVQNNIVKFGGDKNKVTIFGVSAGSASVEYHMLSPLSKNLFHKAILHSGSSLNHWAINHEPKKLITKLMQKLDYKGSTENNYAIYKYLLNIPATVLIKTATEVCNNYTSNRVFFGFVPVIEKDFGDGTAFLTANPLSLLRQGKFNHVPIIKGFCNREGYMTKLSQFKAFDDVNKNRKFVRHWPFQLETEDYEKYDKRFTSAYLENIIEKDDNDTLGLDFFGDFDFIAGIWLSGKLIAAQRDPVYFFQFSYEGTFKSFHDFAGILTKGAAHTDDLTYVFGGAFGEKANENDLLVQRRMTKMWADFSKTSNPTPELSEDVSINWPAYKEDFPAYLKIDKDLNIIKHEYEPKKMAIFEEIYTKYKK